MISSIFLWTALGGLGLVALGCLVAMTGLAFEGDRFAAICSGLAWLLVIGASLKLFGL